MGPHKKCECNYYTEQMKSRQSSFFNSEIPCHETGTLTLMPTDKGKGKVVPVLN
jgi:hypothetical protein